MLKTHECDTLKSNSIYCWNAHSTTHSTVALSLPNNQPLTTHCVRTKASGCILPQKVTREQRRACMAPMQAEARSALLLVVLVVLLKELVLLLDVLL